MRKNILLKICYDGSAFHGWQRQEGLPTVQGRLESILELIYGTKIELEGSGRTDAGVHALGQTATFYAESNLPVERLPKVMNDLLSEGKYGGGYKSGAIKVICAQEVPEDFHGRFNCRKKTYEYRLKLGGGSIFSRNYEYSVYEPLNVKLMEEAACNLIGTHDFRAFQSSGGTPKKSTVRTIYNVEFAYEPERHGDGENEYTNGGDVIIRITGSGFLYNMVRIIVGTLVDIGHGKIPADAVERMLKSGMRSMGGHTAPPEGLYLKEVFY